MPIKPPFTHFVTLSTTVLDEPPSHLVKHLEKNQDADNIGYLVATKSGLETKSSFIAFPNAI
jgi:hypothetical protein